MAKKGEKKQLKSEKMKRKAYERELAKLEGFGPNAVQHLRRTDGFPDAPDILVNGFCNHETREVAAYEELIGCHGGLGGYQTQPFVLYPAQLPMGDGPLVGAAAVHKVLKGWVSPPNGEEEFREGS